MGSKKDRRIRVKLFDKQRGLCALCGEQMLLKFRHDRHAPKPEDLATLDHLYPRGDYRRDIPNRTNEARLALVHNRCNRKRDEEFKAAQFACKYLWGAGQ